MIVDTKQTLVNRVASFKNVDKQAAIRVVSTILNEETSDNFLVYEDAEGSVIFEEQDMKGYGFTIQFYADGSLFIFICDKDVNKTNSFKIPA